RFRCFVHSAERKSSRIVAAACAGLRPWNWAPLGFMHRDEGFWSLHASTVPDHGTSVASVFLWVLLLHDAANKPKGGVRRRIHELQRSDRVRDVGGQHDGHLCAGGI